MSKQSADEILSEVKTWIATNSHKGFFPIRTLFYQCIQDATGFEIDPIYTGDYGKRDACYFQIPLNTNKNAELQIREFFEKWKVVIPRYIDAIEIKLVNDEEYGSDYDLLEVNIL